MDTFRQDLRYACRQLLRRPGFAAVAILSLALGIGGNTAVFGIVDSVRPAPVRLSGCRSPARHRPIVPEAVERGRVHRSAVAARVRGLPARAIVCGHGRVRSRQPEHFGRRHARARVHGVHDRRCVPGRRAAAIARTRLHAGGAAAERSAGSHHQSSLVALALPRAIPRSSDGPSASTATRRRWSASCLRRCCCSAPICGFRGVSAPIGCRATCVSSPRSPGSRPARRGARPTPS